MTAAQRRRRAARVAAGAALAGLLLVACQASGPAAPEAADDLSSRLDLLLGRHVHDGLVDYAALKADPDLGRCLDVARGAEPDQLASRSEKLSFWINAYNLAALEGVATAYPVRSVREIGQMGRFTFFRGLKVTLGGRECTLDTILHKILRPEFHEPRVHFAIVAASRGGPRLRSASFHGATLEEELDAAARAFMADPGRVRLDRGQGILYLSQIFDWFGEDFDRTAGSSAAYVARYFSAEDAAFVARGSIAIRYLDFDWSLNDGSAHAP
ncbi:MAG TPA: DUF547 domain-containing protein [Verrucomicrobiae bacterium]|nr:DUF547 domain-containing protein [Verrucomicrobiae bacterium]